MIMPVFVEYLGEECLVGQIDTQPASGEGFTYSDCWLAKPGAKPLSVSLPLQEERFSAQQMRPYFDGLLPEGSPRAAVARKLHVSSRSYVKILAGLGWECVGAVSFHGEEPRPAIGYAELGEADLRAIADAMTASAVWLNDETRLSLAGAQPKTALYRKEDGTWLRPIGGAPSTHILKPSHARFGDAAINEALCAKAAEFCGLSVAKVEVVRLGGVPMICSERFDRVIGGKPADLCGVAVPTRLHQEDFCQALGVVPEKKYEEGPASYLASMFDLVRIHSTQPLEDIGKLWDAVTFNYLIGNCDAHLKNYALMRSADWRELTVAPLYDLVSTYCYEGLSQELAMRVGESRKLDEVDAGSFEKAAVALSLPLDWALGRVISLVSRIVGAFDEARESLVLSGVADADAVHAKIIGGVHERAERFGENIG